MANVLLLVEHSVPFADVNQTARDIFDSGQSVIGAELDPALAERNPEAHGRYMSGLAAYIRGDRKGSEIGEIVLMGFDGPAIHPEVSNLQALHKTYMLTA